MSRNVLLLGLVSLFTDISSEMVATILPLYLLFSAGLNPLQFGIVDGIYQGASALVRVGGGFFADRWRRHKEVATVGYGLSAVCKLALVAVGSAWAALGAIVLLDRAGKGIRTGPRDALISLSSRRENLAASFGVHRALDTTGAMLGPLLAFGLLALTPLAFKSVFFVSFCIALIGLGIIVLFVKNPPQRHDADAGDPLTVSAAGRLMGSRSFGPLVVAGSALGLVTISDGFVYLGLQRRLDFDPGFFPLLFVGTAAVYMVLAVPIGRLADRVGRASIFVGGYLALLLVYASLLTPGLGAGGIALCILFLGVYYAATDGVLMAIASALLPAEARATGLAVLVTGTSLGRLAASVLFGALWTTLDYETAIAAFAIGLSVATLVAAPVLAVTQRRIAHA